MRVEIQKTMTLPTDNPRDAAEARTRPSELLLAAGSLCLSLVLAATSLTAGCSHKADESAKAPAEKAAGADKPEESRVKTGTNGEVTVTVSAEDQKVIGLQTTALTATQLTAHVQAYGHILDSAPLAGLLTEFQSAQVAAENSRQELARTKLLLSQTNTSERAYATAQAALARDQLAVKATALKIQSAWGAKLTEALAPSAPDAAKNPLAERLASLESVIARVDLPLNEPLAEPKTALILVAEEKPIPAQFLDWATTTDSQLQARGALFLVSNDTKKLIPGRAVTAQIDTSGSPTNGVIIAREAVVRAKGVSWVYLQTSELEFMRREIPTWKPVESGWFVTGSFQAGEKVVTTGAQQLLSEELKGQLGE